MRKTHYSVDKLHLNNQGRDLMAFTNTTTLNGVNEQSNHFRQSRACEFGTVSLC